MTVGHLVELAASVVEIAGIATTLLGVAVAGVLGAMELRRFGGAEAYRRVRRHLGRGILLGLELLVAADIIRTVSEMPSIENVIVLAAIVVIRTFLSFALEIELEGQLPWKRRATGDPQQPAP